MKKYFVLLGVLVFLAASVMGFAGCKDPNAAWEGDTVKVHYTGTLDDGTEFGSSGEGEPLEFVIGDDTMIPGFDKAVRGMKPGETKTVTIPTEDAYGEYDEEKIMLVPWSQLGEGTNPQVGDKLVMYDPISGALGPITVLAISSGGVTIDANHELAGKDLTFKITLVELEKAGVEEAEPSEEPSGELPEEPAE